MRKKYLALLMGIVVMFGATACGSSDDVKIVDKLPDSNAEDSADKSGSNEKKVELTGYIYKTQGKSDIVSVTTDIEMTDVLDDLGEPASYFESESCAFHGLDKVYTYDHYRIETYPDNDKDIISSIVFTDDIAETSEGITIGMTQEDMVNAYGTEYEEDRGMIVYTKDGKHLKFLVQDGYIQSIEYDSAVLDNIEQN